MKGLLSPILAIASATAVLAQTGPTTVQIKNGTLQGARCQSSAVNAFYGIPFAQPPIGDLRFAAPQTVNTTFGTRDATKKPPACIQFFGGYSELPPFSEDCLFLDVFVPANATADSNLPVKVWLYGGANSAGGISNPLYDGCFAATETIMVSVNYRLGPLGFLALENVGANFGIQDQLKGLQWVQDNIAAFGGDPKKVMLHGQSAGAADTFVITSLPQSSSLIKSAALQSGGGFQLPTIQQAQTQTSAFASALNCTGAADIACLRRASVDQLSAASMSPSAMGLGVVIDGTLITQQPLDVGPRVPVIIGSNGLEASLFLFPPVMQTLFTLTASSYDEFLTSTYGTGAAEVNATYPLSRFAASAAPVFTAMATVQTYSMFRCPSRKVINRAVANGVPVWAYNFNTTLTCPWLPLFPNDARTLGVIGAAHTAEIPFVLGQVHNLPLVPPANNCTLTAAEQEVSRRFLAAWDSMAATSAPGGGWPRYSANTSTGIDIQGTDWAVGTVDFSMCDLFDRIAASAPGGNATGGPTQVAGAVAVGGSGFASTMVVAAGLSLLAMALM